MSVESHLGLGSVEGTGLLGQARNRWPVWEQDFPALGGVDGPVEMREWSRANPERGREALLALASLAAVDGWDDPVAAAVLAWALLPGANAVAYRLRDLGPDVPALVAGHLWIAARTISWRTARSVATCVLKATQRAVLSEAVPNRDVTLWGDGLEYVAELSGATRAAGADPVQTAAQELLDVLEWAQSQKVISDHDVRLLVCLVHVAGTLPDGRRGHRQGLLTRRSCDIVAERFGVGPHTVRRRVGASMEALAAVATDIGT